MSTAAAAVGEKPAVAAAVGAATTAPPSPYDEETAFALDWVEIRERLERLHRIKLPEDDPALLIGEAFLLAWKKTGQQMALLLTRQVGGHVGEALVGFTQDLERVSKERREEVHRELMALAAMARGELQAATKASLGEIKAATIDLLQAAKELKLQDRSMRWHDWFIGLLVMASVLVVGIAAGRFLWQ